MTTTLQIVAVIVVLTVLIEMVRNPKLFGKLKVGSEKLGLLDPKILITIGVAVFNLISWAMIPWWWGILTYTWYGFLVFNLGFWLVLYLRTIKTKDKDGKDTKESNPTASKMASIVAVVLLAGLVTATWFYLRLSDLTQEEYEKKVVVEKEMRKAFAKEPVLAIIARCRPAKEFDTAEKVVAASKLYEEKGLLPWQKNMGCWESMISQDMLPVKLAVVNAPVDNRSEVIKNPHMQNVSIDWPSAPAECEIVPNGDESKKLPCQKATFTSPLQFFQFRSTGSKPIRMEVVVRQ